MKKSIIILGMCLSVFLTSCVTMKQHNVVLENNRALIAALGKLNQETPEVSSSTSSNNDCSDLEDANKKLVSEKESIDSSYAQLKQQYEDLVKNCNGKPAGINNDLVEYVKAVHNLMLTVKEERNYEYLKQLRLRVNINELSVAEKEVFDMAVEAFNGVIISE